MQNKRKNCFHNNCCLTLSKMSEISLIFKSTSGIEMSSGVATLPCFYYQYKIVLSLSLNCRINMKILFVYPARLDSLVSLFMQKDSVSFGDGSRDSQPPPLTRCLSISFSLCFSLSLTLLLFSRRFYQWILHEWKCGKCGERKENHLSACPNQLMPVSLPLSLQFPIPWLPWNILVLVYESLYI